MNKSELVEAIAKDTGCSKAEVTRVLDSFIDQVRAGVVSGTEVKIAGFGRFERAAVASRTGRNPKTGDVLTLPASVKPRFAPSEVFKSMVNGA